MTGIRAGVEEEHTRIVLDLSGTGLNARLVQPDPTHARVHLPNARVGAADAKEISNRGLCRHLALEPWGEGLVAVLEMGRACDVRVFGLEAPPRFVIDLYAKASPGAESPAKDPPSEPVDDAPAPKRGGPRIVVIDPGHGGDDPGAVAPGLREKDVCLDVARRVHKLLSIQEGVHPILSRSRDVLIPLRKRMRLAEEANADLFVSIHVNSARTTAAKGVEVFFLSIGGASDEAARELARLENEVDEETDEASASDGANLPFSLSLRQSDTLLRSSRAAETVLDLLVDRGLAANRGVRQANFTVLRSYQVPSILVEIGFASSPEDREALKSDVHRDRLANAIAEGLARYFETYAPVRAEK